MNENKENEGVEDEIYAYQLVEFVKPGRKGQRQVDIVPSFWARYNIKKAHMETQFPPPPYSEEVFRILKGFVEKRAFPLKNWPYYTVKLVGRARTYQDGLAKLLLLENNDNVVYTADSDLNAGKKAEFIKNKYKERVKESHLPKMPSPPVMLSSTSDDESDSWADEEMKYLLKSKKRGTKSRTTKKRSKKNTNKLEGATMQHSYEKKSLDDGTQYDDFRKTQNEVNTKTIPNIITKNMCKDEFLANANVSEFENMTTINSNDARESEDLNNEASNEKNSDNTQEISRQTHSPSQDVKKNAKKKTETEKGIQFVSSDTQLLLSTMKGISVVQNEILNKLDVQEELLRSLAAKAGLTSSSKGFISNHNLNLPFNEITEFIDFNNKLQDDEVRNDFLLSLHSLMDRDFNVAKSVLNIIKKYMAKDLAMQFTNVKKANNKFVLKDYRLHQCILDAVLETHIGQKNVLEKHASEAIGNALSGSRDWQGGRKERLEAKTT